MSKMSKTLDLVDDLRVSILDLETDNTELNNQLNLNKTKTSSRAGKTVSFSTLNKSSAKLVIDMFYESGALSNEVKIGKHPKTTGIEKEGLAKCLTDLFKIAGMSGEFKAFNSAIIIPS